MLTIAPADLLGSEAQLLITQLNQELSQRYPEPGANHFRLDPTEVGAGRGAFLIARLDGAPVGCGAVRVLEPGRGEIKRMFTLPAARGTGIGRALLAALEEAARDLGIARLLLETGIRQPEAIRLYESSGFQVIPCWGEYVASAATSVCMEKDLPK